MPKPAPSVITTPPNTPSQPYDAYEMADTPPFIKIHGGPCDLQSGQRVAGSEWGSLPGQESRQSRGPWRKT